jgi:signal transduction protein with GAF and PtsI domain
MEDLENTLQLNSSELHSAETRSLDGAATKTAPLPRLDVATDKSPAQRKAEDFRNGQGRILQMIAANAPLSEVLNRLMLLIEAQSPGMHCSVLLLSEDGEHMRHGAAPSLPEEYVQEVDGGPIGPKNGSCGTAMYRGEPVFVTDIFSDPLWEDYRDIAAASKMRACWSTPIMSGRGKVLGSFAMYYEEPRTPTGDEADLTEVATRIAGLALEHHAAGEILQRTQAALAQATHAASSGKVAVSIADEVNNQLQAILNNAKKCLEILDEDRPDIASFREPLKNIESHGRRALDVLTRIRSQKM